MDDKTLAALQASIVKWEKNAQASSIDEMLTGVGDCPLCTLFYSEECRGCPVADAVDNNFCYGTPYYDVVEAETDAEAILAAHAEVEFLRSLLPKE